MGLIEDLRLFVIAQFENPTERKKALNGLNTILEKYRCKEGHCAFCNQEFNAEIKGLLTARSFIFKKYTVPVDFLIDQRLKELNWDIEEKGVEFK